MANSLHVAQSKKEINHDVDCGKNQPKQSIVASIPKHYPQVILKRIINVDEHSFGLGAAAKVGLFLVKLVVLEGVRRFSKDHCPFLWSGLQALPCISLPPFKWLQKWEIFRGLSKFMQALSRPLLVLSVTTAFSDKSVSGQEASGSSDTTQHVQSDSLDGGASTESRITHAPPADEWLSQLSAELAKDGMVLPERFTSDDLRRFHKAAKGDFSSFLNSVKKTIVWRQNFRFLSAQELERWSETVFWHGRDRKGHPCLFIRVAPACFNMSEERSRLPEVVVSQIEHGIVQLVPAEDPLVTVLMDCEGLTPFRFPLQMMRSCAILLQDHYPNRLAALLVVRLPPIARVIAQTLFQVLRPGTRKKLRIVRDQSVLSEHLETLPSFLGGACLCPKCSNQTPGLNDVSQPSVEHEYENLLPPISAHSTGDFEFVKWHKVVKTVVLGLLILLLCIVFSVQVRHFKDLHLYT